MLCLVTMADLIRLADWRAGIDVTWKYPADMALLHHWHSSCSPGAGQELQQFAVSLVCLAAPLNHAFSCSFSHKRKVSKSVVVSWIPLVPALLPCV